jgi:TetR/AcrR family transcriptional regulator
MAVPTETSGRRAQRRGQAQRLGRDHLLDAAEEVFGRNGFHDTSLKDVAAAAEFSVGTIYNFFENKDDLFRQIFQRRGEEFMVGLRALLAAEGDAVAQLHALVDFEVGFFRTHPHFARLYLREASSTLTSTNAQIDAITRGRYDEAMTLQAGLFARGQAAGGLRGGDPVVLARLFSGLVASFQSTDPAIVTGDAGAAERLPLTELHTIVDGAFRA